MPYSRPTLTTLRNQAITDLQSASFNSGGSPLLQKSILRILSIAQAGMTYELYAFLDWISQQSVPYTASGEYLVAWAALKSVTRIAATSATGSATFVGTTGTLIPSGTVLARSDGVQYRTMADWTVGSASGVSIIALVPGAAGNAVSGTALSIASPLAGVTSSGSATSPLLGGTDQELDDSLRSRMLSVYASPPNGGSIADYVNWALQVPGVTRAWAIPQGAGVGTVMIYIMLDNNASGGFPVGSGGAATLETRYPAATGDQLSVADHIYPLRPVTALVVVAGPAATTVNFTIQALNPSNSTIQAAVLASLQDCFLRLGSATLNTIYPSDTNSAIESAAGVGVYTLVSPVTPITTAVGFIPVVGAITWTT